MLKKEMCTPDLATHACNPSSGEVEAGEMKLEANLGYTVSPCQEEKELLGKEKKKMERKVLQGRIFVLLFIRSY
jgi:hypothetical protein